MIDLSALEALRQMEKDHDQLQKLPLIFEEQMTTYMSGLKVNIDAARNYHDVELLRDEEKNARLCYEDLMELRKGKIIDQAIANRTDHMEHGLLFEKTLFNSVSVAAGAHKVDSMRPVDEAYRGKS